LSTVTILTDFGLKDPYVGIMKGVMLTLNPQVNLVDITHEIEPQDVREAAFLIPEYYHFFPRGSVHLCVVDPTVGSARKPLVAAKNGHFFVGPDNGLFSFLLEGAAVYEIVNRSVMLATVSDTFHGRDVFAPAAAHLSLSATPDAFGPVVGKPFRLDALGPVVHGDIMTGEIVRFDRFGNAISNIEVDAFHRFVEDGLFEMQLKGMGFARISKSYYEGSYTCVIGSSGYLEFALFNGSLREDKRVRKGDDVTITRRTGG
jgi:S-adenosyl-L-methionine hydrolase (adenosine-forming)